MIASVDVNARCEDFDGSVCIGTVFYNGSTRHIYNVLVFVNQSYNQQEMSSDAQILFNYAGLPGVPSSCLYDMLTIL